MISDEYKALNSKLHKQSEHFGSSAWRCWKEWIVPFVYSWPEQSSILDYGCGKATVSQNFPGVTNYDPAIEGEFSEDPVPCDLVLCIDVMEHVEEEFIDAVLDHIKSKTILAAFFVISVRPACAKLPDGRNAHITLKPQAWWMRKLMYRWQNVHVVTEKENDHFAISCYDNQEEPDAG